jgi:hypothetical protein
VLLVVVTVTVVVEIDELLGDVLVTVATDDEVEVDDDVEVLLVAPGCEVDVVDGMVDDVVVDELLLVLVLVDVELVDELVDVEDVVEEVLVDVELVDELVEEEDVLDEVLLVLDDVDDVDVEVEVDDDVELDVEDDVDVLVDELVDDEVEVLVLVVVTVTSKPPICRMVLAGVPSKVVTKRSPVAGASKWTPIGPPSALWRPDARMRSRGSVVPSMGTPAVVTGRPVAGSMSMARRSPSKVLA